MAKDMISRVEETIRNADPHVVSASQLADEIDDLDRRGALDYLNALKHVDKVDRNKVGARAVAWWHVDRTRQPNGPTSTVIDDAPDVDPEPEIEIEPEPSTDDSQPLEEVLEGWSPGRTPTEAQERRESGLAVLEWLRDSGETVSAADVKDRLHGDLGVNGQSQDTWWRKVARPAIQKADAAGLVDEKMKGSRNAYSWSSSSSSSSSGGS